MDWMRLPDRPRAVCLAAVIAIALLATLPATALATFGISGFIAAPDDPTAGAHSDFTIHFAVDDPGNNLKAFVVHLPPGQTGDPSATARCTQDEFAAGGCAPAARVGAIKLTASGSDISGDVYNLLPTPPEPARLGIVLHPPSGDQRVQAPIALRADGGLDATVDGLPAIGIAAVEMTLTGTNPTSCVQATTAVDAYSYAAPAQAAEGAASYTPTACELLPFGPALGATVHGTRQTARGAHPGITAVIGQPPGRAGVRTVTLTLPAGIAIDPAVPSRSALGSVQATTPLLAPPLTGPITLTPELTAGLTGFGTTIRLQGTLAPIANGRLQAVLDGLPDLALSSLAISFDPNRLLLNTRDLCTGASRFVDAVFTAQSGAQWPTGVPATVEGCPPAAPIASGRLTGVAKRKPVLHVRITAAPGGTIRQAGVGLPSALRFVTSSRHSTVTTLANAKPVRRPSVRLTSTAVSVDHLGRRARTVELRFGAGALRLVRKLRVGSRVTLRVGYVDAGMHARRSALKVVARR